MTNHLPLEKGDIEGSLVARWQRVVERFADETAVTTADGARHPYAELDQDANRLAHALVERFGPANGPVVVLLDHSYPLVVSILGALKAGKAFVAFDTAQAVEQLQFLYQTTGAPVVVTCAAHQALAQAITAAADGAACDQHTVLLLETLPEIRTGSPALTISPDAIATIVFTSGTINQPKGVARSHRIVLHRTWHAIGEQPFGPGHCIAGIRHCGLGGGILYLFYALMYGATYCLYDLQRGGLRALSEWLQQQRVNTLSAPIALFRQWLDTLAPDDFYPHLRYIAPSGRKTRADLERLWPHVGHDCAVLTGYAATEVDQITSALITRTTPLAEGVLHVGTPLPDRTLLIVKDDGQRAAAGEVGEIQVRSRYIPTGYWRQPELTAQRFTPADDGSGETLYRTGDYGLLRSDGTLELVGRHDSQVKLRGYRVVLGEVEDALRALPEVKDAVVTADEAQGILLAYVIAASDPPPLPVAIRAALARQVPAYALPNHVIFLPQFPLLPSGKVNRRALPAPEQTRAGLTTPYVPPRNEIEARLVVIWEELLTVHPIGVQDSFFDLGGHSIVAMRLLCEMEQQFQQPIALEQFIFQPTIAHLATLFRAPPGDAGGEAQQIDEDLAPSAGVEDTGLRSLYDALEDKAEIDRLRDKVRPKPRRPRYLRLLLRLPQPVALRLLYRLLQQPWARQRYFRHQTPLVQQFLAGFDQPPKPEQLMARCLFFGALNYYGLRADIFPRLQATGRIPIAGQEALEAARRQGQGVILLTSHCYQMTYFRSFRLTQGGIGNMVLLTTHAPFDTVSAEHILYSRQLEIVRHRLQEGQVIYLAPDTNRGYGTTITVPFHGRLRQFRTSFAELALLTGAQLFFVASELERYDRFSFQLVGPLDRGSAALTHKEHVQHLVMQYVAHLRQQWARDPWALPWWIMSEHLAYPRAEGQTQPT